MSDVFISHASPDWEIAEKIARELERAGYTTWYYERDCLPGESYITQTGNAIEETKAFLLIISADAIARSRQLDVEVIRAHESGKLLIPVLHGLTHDEFRARQPMWRQVCGVSTAVAIPPEGVAAIASRIVDGLGAAGIPPGNPREDRDKPVDRCAPQTLKPNAPASLAVRTLAILAVVGILVVATAVVVVVQRRAAPVLSIEKPPPPSDSALARESPSTPPREGVGASHRSDPTRDQLVRGTRHLVPESTAPVAAPAVSVAAPSVEETSGSSDAIDSLALTLVASMTNRPGRRIRVTTGAANFGDTRLAGPFAARLRDALYGAARQSDWLSVMDRATVISAKGGQSAPTMPVPRDGVMVPEAEATLLGIDAVLTARYYVSRQGIRVLAGLVSNRGEILGHGEGMLRLSALRSPGEVIPTNYERVRQSPLAAKARLDAPSMPFPLVLVADRGEGATYQRGDRFSALLISDRACHVVVLHHRADGMIVQIYPPRPQIDATLRGGVVERMPVRAGRVSGQEWIEAFAGTGPLPELPTTFRDSELTVAATREEIIAVMARGVSGGKTGTISRANCAFLVIE